MPLDQDPIEERAEGEMSFLDHLEELRWHVVRAVIAIIICTIIGFIYVDWVFENVLLAPAKSDFLTWRALCRLGEMINNPDLCIKDIPLTLQSRFMTGQFTVMIVSALVLGLVLAFPYVIWELWRFIRPGLYSRERKNSRGVVGAITFLFILGISFGFYVVSPLMVYIMVNFKLSDLIVVIFFLSKIGLVTPSFLRTYRKHAIVIILIVAAIITPPDVLSQVLITLPLYLLFEISILISARVERNKQREEAEELLKEQQSSKV
jgi:sec-independent protein translocase protein TatC